MSISPQVYINGRFLCRKATGVQKFALGLSAALQKKYPDVLLILPKGNYNCYGLNVRKSGWGSGFFWEQIWLPLYLWFHSRPLLINLCNTAPLLYKKQIVTVHDLAFLKDKSWFSPAFRRWYKYLIPRLCRKSLAIITVSEFIKKEIIYLKRRFDSKQPAFFLSPQKPSHAHRHSVSFFLKKVSEYKDSLHDKRLPK